MHIWVALGSVGLNLEYTLTILQKRGGMVHSGNYQGCGRWLGLALPKVG